MRRFSNFTKNKNYILWIKTVLKNKKKACESYETPIGVVVKCCGINHHKQACLSFLKGQRDRGSAGSTGRQKHGSGGLVEKKSPPCSFAFSHFSKLTTSLCLLALEQRFPSEGVNIIYETDQGVTVSLHEV